MATDHFAIVGPSKPLEQLVSCHTRSVILPAQLQETAKDSPVWMTLATLVRLNWRLRNVLFTYLLKAAV